MDASKSTTIHPAVRKLLGKTVRAADVHSLLAETAAGHRYTQHHTASSSHSSTVKVCCVIVYSLMVSLSDLWRCLIYVAAKATYIRLLHGKIGFLGGFSALAP